jgi:hypothetical protein
MPLFDSLGHQVLLCLSPMVPGFLAILLFLVAAVSGQTQPSRLLPADSVVILSHALRPIAVRLGDTDFIAEVSRASKNPGVRITAADLAALPYPQSIYDRIAVNSEMLSMLRLSRTTLESLGISTAGWHPKLDDFSHGSVADLWYLKRPETAVRVREVILEFETLMSLASVFHDDVTQSFLTEGYSRSLGELEAAGIPLKALQSIPLTALDPVDWNALSLGVEDALTMGALPPSAKDAVLTFGDLRRCGLHLTQMPGLILSRNQLVEMSLMATGLLPIDSACMKSEYGLGDGLFLKDFLKVLKAYSPQAWQSVQNLRNGDTLHLDTLDFSCLIRRHDSLYLLTKPEWGLGYRMAKPVSHIPPANRSETPYNPSETTQAPTQAMPPRAPGPVLPVFRLGIGYSHFVLAQLGLVWSHGPSLHLPVYSMGSRPFVAGQIGANGFAGVLGMMDIHYGGGHSPPFFATLALAIHQDWREPRHWNLGPLVQIGFMNVGMQASLRYGNSWGGDIGLLFQLHPR